VLGFAEKVTDADAAVGLDRVRALVPFQPTASRAFLASDTLRVFLTSAWRSSTTTLNVDVAITGNGTPRKQHLTVDAAVANSGGRQARIDTTLPLSDLPPGSYVLSVSAAAGKEKPVTRALPFVIRAPH